MKRYSKKQYYEHEKIMEECKSGEWVKYEDHKKIFKLLYEEITKKQDELRILLINDLGK